jgi:hypothetical protein
MFRSAIDHHQGVNLYLVKNYSVITVVVLFHGYWLCGSILGVDGYCCTWSHSITHARTHTYLHSVKLLWTSDQPVQ